MRRDFENSGWEVRMPLASSVLSESEAFDRLAELGLTSSRLWEVVLAGEAARDSTTVNHPLTAGGFYAWSEDVKHLRDYLLPLSWTRKNVCNLPLVVSPDGRVAIFVTTGTPETGTLMQAKTKHDKGDITFLIVEKNKQLDLIPGLHNPGETPSDLEIEEAWILLVYRSGDIVRAELSSPRDFDDQRRICGWRERILLGQRDLGAPGSGTSLPPSGPSIDVPVSPIDI
jgi:hypothetical protein